MNGNVKLGTLVLLFMGIIVALALINPIASSTNIMTSLQSVTDETTDLSTSCLTNNGWVNESNPNCNITVDSWYAAGDWRRSDAQCYISSVTVGNDTTAYTLNTDYKVFSSSGIIQMLNTTDTYNETVGNSVYVDYSFCGEGYNPDSGSRSIANLILIFSALALLAFAVIGLRREWFK